MKEQFTTRIESDILDSVKNIANKERRSLNNTIEFLLATAIELYNRRHDNGSLIDFKTEGDKH